MYKRQSSLSVTEDTAASGTIAATDIDGDTLSYTYSTPSKGTVAQTTAGAYSYTPTANATGVDNFTATVSDGTESVTQTVNVSISAVNDEPILSVSGLTSIAENETNAVAATVTGSDIEDGSLTVSLTGSGRDAVSYTHLTLPTILLV